MANVENVSDDELPPIDEEQEEEEEEDGEIPVSPQEDKVEDVLSDIRCGCAPQSGKFCFICTLMDSEAKSTMLKETKYSQCANIGFDFRNFAKL